MGLKKTENQVKHLLGDTIVALCRNTLNYASEINVEGLIGITLDNDEIFLVNINQTINNPDLLNMQDKDNGHKLQSPSEGSDRTSSDDSSSEDCGAQSDSSPKRKRRKRNRRKHGSNSPGDKHATRSSTRNKRSQEQALSHSNMPMSNWNIAPNSSTHSFTTPSAITHANAQSANTHSNNLYSTSNVSLSTNAHSNVAQCASSTAERDTGQNGVVSVKEEVLSDDHDDEDLVIVKEEIGDAANPNPVLLFPNVSQTLHSSDPFLAAMPHSSLQQSIVSTPSQSFRSSSPVAGPSNLGQPSVPWFARMGQPFEVKKKPTDPVPSQGDCDFQTSVQFKLDVLLGMMGDLQQSMILNLGTPEQLEDMIEGPCTSVDELEQLSRRLETDHAFKQRMIQSLVSIGGHNVKDCVRRMIRKLGTQDVWGKYSFYGRKGKRCFKDLALCHVVCQANLQNHKESKLQEIEEIVSHTLRHEPFRCKRARMAEAGIPFDFHHLHNAPFPVTI